MIRRRNRDRPNQRDLAAYADGSLDPARRARVERAVAESPDLEAEVRAQRLALDAVHNLNEERAPAALRARVAASGRGRPRRRSVFTLATAGAVAGATAVALVLGGGAAETPPSRTRL